MRYLFGDSTPFPLTFDFLATLDAFVECAGQVVRLEAESRKQEKSARDEAALRVRSIDGIERFHQTVLKAMRETSMRSLDNEVIDYATRVTEYATRYVEDMKVTSTSKTDREVAQLNIDVQRRREEARVAIERFFVTATLPVLDSRWSMRLHGGPKDAYHEVSVVETHPSGIICAVLLDPSIAPEWRHPRKVGELAPNLELLVGAKRSWFNKSVQRDLLRLDDYVVSAFELDDEKAEIHLKKRVDQKDDSLIFSLRRVDADLHVEVSHPDDQEVDQVLPAQVEAQDKPHVERLWQTLRSNVATLRRSRQRVTSLHIDMVDVFDTDRTSELIDRLIGVLAPTAQEVARRSPNASELSLKEEGVDGRRREIYLRKDDLVRKLEPLTPEDRPRFFPLAVFPLGSDGGAGVGARAGDPTLTTIDPE